MEHTTTHAQIYKKTQSGGTNIWYVEQVDNCYRTVHGQKHGNLVYSEWTTCEAKHVGQKNERDSIAQCKFEIEAMYKKKLDRDYYLEEGDHEAGSKIFEPMLAYEWDKKKKTIGVEDGKFEECIFSQPKLDGMRCIATAHGLFSRTGEPIVSVPHIEEAMAPFFTNHPHFVLDGELYNHELYDDFNSILSIMRKTKLTEDDLQKSLAMAQYHVYDLYNPKWVEADFTQRSDGLKQAVDIVRSEYLWMVPTTPVRTVRQLDDLYAEYRNSGYEGQMIRLDRVYENKRSNYLLKRKESIDTEFECLDIRPGKGNWSGAAKVAFFKNDKGVEFKASITGTKENCAELLAHKDKFIGTMCTVRYFALTPESKKGKGGVPRFGRVVNWARTDFDKPKKKSIIEEIW